MNPNTTKNFNDTAYFTWLLRTRENPADRSLLRRAGLAAASYMADPLVLQWTADHRYLDEPLRHHASMAARFNHIDHRKGVRLGQLAHRLGSSGVMQPTNVVTRLVQVQRRQLGDATPILTGLLAAANNAGGYQLDWFDMWLTFRYWNAQPEDYPKRRQLLIDYYRNDPSTSKSNRETQS